MVRFQFWRGTGFRSHNFAYTRSLPCCARNVFENMCTFTFGEGQRVCQRKTVPCPPVPCLAGSLPFFRARVISFRFAYSYPEPNNIFIVTDSAIKHIQVLLVPSNVFQCFG